MSCCYVNFRYFSTAKELTDYLGSLHESAAVPDLLLVDDLHMYMHLMHQVD